MVHKLLILQRVGLGGVEGLKLLRLCTVFTLCILSTHTHTVQMDAHHNSVKK